MVAPSPEAQWTPASGINLAPLTIPIGDPELPQELVAAVDIIGRFYAGPAGGDDEALSRSLRGYDVPVA